MKNQNIFTTQITKFVNKVTAVREFMPIKQSSFLLGESFNRNYYYQVSIHPMIEWYYTTIIINGLLVKLFKIYNVKVEWNRIYEEEFSNYKSILSIEDDNSFEFIIHSEEGNVAYRYTISQNKYNIDNSKYNSLLTIDWKSYLRSEAIKNEYNSIISLHDFCLKYFDEELYSDLIVYLTNVEDVIENILGIKSVSALNKKNYHLFRQKKENELNKEINNLLSYIVIEDDEKQTSKFSENLLNNNKCKEEFIIKQYYKIFTGENEISKSFLTSEFLYDNYQYVEEFDSTCIVSGYLKSIEQLLYRICLEHINTGLMINNQNKLIKEENNDKKYKPAQIVLSEENLKYINSTLDSLISFLTSKNNWKKTLICTKKEKGILKTCLNYYRKECRNSHFHKDILTEWKKVEIIRKNSIYLYCALLTLTSHNIYNFDDFFDNKKEYY